jgi:putative Mg2+ transporter-C (MgtC) family protein
MGEDYARIALHLVTALVAGGLIGLERTYHGRPAGFRTHALVCLASALLMEVTTHQFLWIGQAPADALRADPQRIAQGIMTGIGFLGAGVIFKEGLTVRGLTTAASIWVTSALGILYGVGLYYTAVSGTVLTLGTLSVLRKLEDRLEGESYARLRVRFAGDRTMPEDDLRRLVTGHGFTVLSMEYLQEQSGVCFEYRMVIRTMHRRHARRLAEALRATTGIIEFQITPSSE